MSSAVRHSLVSKAAHCKRPKGLRRGQQAFSVRAQSYQSNGDGTSQLGDRILNKLRTPLDLLALPGRVAAGALTSFPDVVQKIPADLERISYLAQDPRPMEEKQQEVMQELESRVVRYLDKGTNLEADVLNNISSVLPQEVKDALPAEVKDLLDKPHLHVEDRDFYAASSNGSTPGMNAMGEEIVEYEAVAVSPAELAASQIASEMSELRTAVLELQAQLESMKSNTDPSKANMLKVNVKEAREALALHLRQLSSTALSTQDPPARAAINEAEQLLTEVSTIL